MHMRKSPVHVLTFVYVCLCVCKYEGWIVSKIHSFFGVRYFELEVACVSFGARVPFLGGGRVYFNWRRGAFGQE